MEKWIRENLSQLLDFPVLEDLSQYIMEIQNERDLDDYMKSLLDFKDPKHKQFVTELKKRQAANKDQIGNKKANNMHNTNRKQNKKRKGNGKSKENIQVQEIVKPEKVEKKKTKFVNLYSQEGSDRATVFLKGRHKCDCEAKKHKLINNCLNCGRIVCAQEGAGPCSFCGNLVCSTEEQKVLSSNTKQADHLYNKLMCQKANKSLEDSLKQRDKLLDYDRNSTRCTKVIDDESDYYRSNSVWLSAKEREILKKHEDQMNDRKHASRLNKKITFDFAGRQIVEEEDPVNEFSEEQFRELCESIPFDELENSNVCPTIEFDRPVYIELNKSKSHKLKTNTSPSTMNRIQDKEYLEMSDKGLCLSMHQPYASLLVAGIKTHEGRTWYTSHRGRLWIASTCKTPTKEEISDVQHYYRVLKDEKIKFPENYTCSCLLGCVTVTDVLPQEEYRKIYPDGESECPYVFICEEFHALPIKFPIQGKHKIYKLDEKIHQAALKTLEKLTLQSN